MKNSATFNAPDAGNSNLSLSAGSSSRAKSPSYETEFNSVHLDSSFWPACAQIFMSTRLGGVSKPPYESNNLGTHVGDVLDDVLHNRVQLMKTAGVHAVFLTQVHDNTVLRIDELTPFHAVADACFTTQHQVACTIMVADCLPVLITHPSGAFVAAAHAGWRGLSGAGCAAGLSVLDTLAQSLFKEGLLAAPSLQGCVAWLGPCIGPQEFEVGSDVREAFIQAFKGTGVDVSACFLSRAGKASRQSTGQVQGVRGISQPSELAQNKWLANLPELAKARLRLLGVEQILGNNGQDAWCTVRNEDLFFSHRRDKVSGRQAAFIWLTDSIF